MKQDWFPAVIHPQSGEVCWVRPFSCGLIWPDEFVGHFTDPRPWPVPWIRGARLVDCGSCHKTGIQPKTAEDLVWYVPGTRLEDNRIIYEPRLGTVRYPTGSGEDEDDPG